MYASDSQRVKSLVTGAPPTASAQPHVPMETIAALSEKFGRPVDEVLDLYKAELDGLVPVARVTNFLATLAVSRTRSNLRARTRIRS